MAHHDVIFRNRLAHLRDRDCAYQAAVDELLSLIDDLPRFALPDADRDELGERINRLVNHFGAAQRHALSAKGGDYRRFPDVVSLEEEVFIDFIKTMFSAAKNVKAYYRHEALLQSFLDEHPELDSRFGEYFCLTVASDMNAMFRNLEIMAQRVEDHHSTFAEEAPADRSCPADKPTDVAPRPS